LALEHKQKYEEESYAILEGYSSSLINCMQTGPFVPGKVKHPLMLDGQE